VVNFHEQSHPIQVEPRVHANLLISLTSKAAIWISTEPKELSAYHLRDSTDPRKLSAVKYINDNWYFLTRTDRKYYIDKQITTLRELGLGNIYASILQSIDVPGGSTPLTSVSGSSPSY
jgi:hypothetical protein